MFKKKLTEWSMLPAEVEVTHFYGTVTADERLKGRERMSGLAQIC